jgi:protein-disulfide isomerase
VTSRAQLRIPVSDADHLDGDPRAALVLVEYGDYQCPHCGRAAPIVKQVQRALGDRLLFVFRHFPLSEIHPDAVPAAQAAEAAGRQDHFWKMHDALFEDQLHLDEASLVARAGRLRLDLDRFVADANDPEVSRRISADLEGGARSGVNGTPTFFVNGRRLDGAASQQSLMAALEAVESDHAR